MTKTIAVFGATGQQGGSVVRSLVRSGDYQVKAITRNPNSEKAKQLAQLVNCSVHQADLDDPSSIDNALQDCYGVFLVTEFKINSINKEVKQGIDLIDSALKNNVTHMVYSGSENIKDVISKSCILKDPKSAVEDYGLMKSDTMIFTSIRLPAYHQILLDMFIYRTEENEFILPVPVGKNTIYSMDVNETGICVEYIFNNPNEFKSKIVPVATDKFTLEELIEMCNEYLKPYKFVNGNYSLEKYMSTGFPNIKDFAALFEFINSGHYVRDIELTLKMISNPLKLRDWFKKNKQELVNYLYLNKI